MRFFESFPTTFYRFDEREDPFLMTHILRRFKFRETVRAIVSTWDSYVIGDHETPETLAYIFYGDANLHWVILLFNDIIDPFTDWPMDPETLTKFIEGAYEEPDAVHHWELNGKVVPSGTTGAVSVSNRVYEERINEHNRRIRIPKKEHIHPISVELERVLKEDF